MTSPAGGSYAKQHLVEGCPVGLFERCVQGCDGQVSTELHLMVEWARRFLSEIPLFVLTAICAHLVMSSSQTLFHYGLGHHRIGGNFYRNHIRFQHSYYAKGRLVSSTYRR